MKPSYHIVLISSGQPSLNPRLVKEADALADAGYKVTVIYQYWNKWGTDLDIQLLKSKKWDAYRVGGSLNEQKLIYWYTRIRHKLANFLIKLLGHRDFLSEQAIGRCSILLAKKAKTIKADLYIGHNLGALPAVVKAAKNNKSKCGFDAEDFHRFEESNCETDPKVKLKISIENRYINQLDYLTTASPLINEVYQELYPKLRPISLLNVFPKQNLSAHSPREKAKLKLFWFSQTIGPGRGLKNIVEALSELNHPMIELHLLGDHNAIVKNQLISSAKYPSWAASNIFFHAPILPDKIFSFAAQFDIGLATESSYPLNRDICLTNKIFTYIQSGLAVIATDTPAQTRLLNEYPNTGFIYNSNYISDLKGIINKYFYDRTLLDTHQKQSLNYAISALNWELEKRKFLSLINSIIG